MLQIGPKILEPMDDHISIDEEMRMHYSDIELDEEEEADDLD